MKRPILMIVLLLILLNAASLYWFTQRAPVEVDTTETPQATPTGVARLELISEVPPGNLIVGSSSEEHPTETTAPVVADTPAKPSEVAASTKQASGPAPVGKRPYCFVTPPFAAAAGDDAVLRTLEHIPDVEVNTTDPEPVTQSTTYWVRLTGFRPLKEAMAIVKELHGKSIKDVATTPVKGRETVVSLGLYRFAQSAHDRQREFQDMGYDTEIIELKKTHTGLRYRINILAGTEAQARAYLREYRNAFPDHPPVLQDCSE